MVPRCTSHGIAFAFILALVGCSSAGDSGSGPADDQSSGCALGETFECACADGTTSTQVCNDSGALDPCMCGSTSGSAGTGGATTGTGGATTSTGGATTGTGGSTTGTGGSTAGSGGEGGVQGTGGSTGGAGGAAPGSGGGPAMTAQDPAIPPVDGPCPTFSNQTLDFMSLSGIQMTVGPQSNGTGVLLFYWHGTGSNAGEVGIVPQAAQQRILDTGGIIVSPQSSSGSTNGVQASGTSVWFEEDLDTADQITACAVRDYGIDPRRIYATGCSAGGLMAGYMARQRSQYIAAVAPNSGGALGGSFDGAAHVPPVMTMHGAAGVDVVVIDFAERSLLLTSEVVSAGGFAIDCDHGGGHCGAPSELYSSAIQFLLDHPFGVSPEPYASNLPAGFPSYCQIQ